MKYFSTNDTVQIICHSHGEFEQKASGHISGSGCPMCGKENRADFHRMSTDEFIVKATTLHGERYDYSLVDYKSSKEYVLIICHRHGTFEQRAGTHLTGAGCKLCGFEATKKQQTKTTVVLNVHKRQRLFHMKTSLKRHGSSTKVSIAIVKLFTIGRKIT